MGAGRALREFPFKVVEVGEKTLGPLGWGGCPTAPQPLEILIQLAAPANLSRVVVYETASGQSYEIYTVLVSADGKVFTPIGSAQQGSRGEENCISYRFPEQEVRTIKIVTQGCHGLTFSSFSRLCEVMAFAE